MSLRIYLAHPMGTYGSTRERRAIALLEDAGFTVVNPRERQYGALCGKGMDRWKRLAAECDAVAWLPFPDGRVGSGMRLELVAAAKLGKPLFEFDRDVTVVTSGELPPRRLTLDIGQTRLRNERAGALREKAGVPLACADTVIHEDLIARVQEVAPTSSAGKRRRRRLPR